MSILKKVLAGGALATGFALTAMSSAVAATFTVERVTFSSGGQTLVGNLYVPSGASQAKPATAAVVTGAWMTIKEQMAGHYAQELAKKGVMALAFDFRTWGESQGQPRAMENPQFKIEDIQAAAAYLASRSDVDRSKIVGLGICASAGYMVEAAARSSTLRSVALVAPWLHDRAIVNAVYGGVDSVEGLIAAGRTAQSTFVRTGQAITLTAASTTDKSAVMFGVPYYTEASRGLLPQWENRFNVASWEPWLTFDAMASASRLKVPLLIVHSEAAAIPQGARQYLHAVTSPKRAVWLDNVGQFDFYDQPAPVKAAIEAALNHFAGV